MNGEATTSDEIAKAKIRQALLSGPDCITRDASVTEMGPDGKVTVLRPGTNGGVDEVDAERHRAAKHTDRLGAIAWRTRHALADETHRPVIRVDGSSRRRA